MQPYYFVADSFAKAK
jgi:hypothetical protein